MPTEPVTLTPEEVEELNKHLSTMRHDINNQLSLVVAALELIRYKPEMREKMIGTLGEQPPKIMESIAQFSALFEAAVRITRD